MAEVKEKIAQEEAAKKKKNASAGEGDGGTTPSSAASAAAAAKEAEAAKKSALEAAMAATLAAYAPKAGQATATNVFTGFRRESQLDREQCSSCCCSWGNQFALLSPGSIVQGKQ